MLTQFSNNVPKLYAIKISRWLLFFMPTIITFFTETGLSMKEIAIVQAVFSIVLAIFEIPSGYLSDVIGRKKTLVLGCITGFLGFLIYGISFGFTGFIMASIVLGISSSLVSGTDSALLYESLVQVKRSHHYMAMEGKLGASGNFAEAGAAIIGAFVATNFGLRTPFYLMIFMHFLTIPLALSLVEPPRLEKNKKGSFKDLLEVVRFSLVTDPRLKWFIWLPALLGTATLFTAWFSQPYFTFVGLPLWWFGVVWAALNLTVGLSAWFVKPLSASFTRKQLLILLFVVLVVSCLAIGQISAIGGILFVFAIYVVRGISGPYFRNIIMGFTPPDYRATILSVQSLLVRLIYSAISPVLGYIMDLYDIQTTFLLVGLSLFLAVAFVLVKMIRQRIV